MTEDSKDNAAKPASVRGKRVEHRRAVGAGANDAGGLTDAPKDESPRTASRQVTKASDSGDTLVEAPDAGTQLEPREGNEYASTNPVADFAALRNFAGENHVRFVDEDGNEVSPDSVFDDPGPDVTYVVAGQTVYEEFRYPGVLDAMTRQYVLAGRRYPKDKAARLAAVAGRAKAQTEQAPDPAA